MMLTWPDRSLTKVFTTDRLDAPADSDPRLAALYATQSASKPESQSCDTQASGNTWLLALAALLLGGGTLAGMRRMMSWNPDAIWIETSPPSPGQRERDIEEEVRQITYQRETQRARDAIQGDTQAAQQAAQKAQDISQHFDQYVEAATWAQQVELQYYLDKWGSSDFYKGDLDQLRDALVNKRKSTIEELNAEIQSLQNEQTNYMADIQIQQANLYAAAMQFQSFDPGEYDGPDLSDYIDQGGYWDQSNGLGGSDIWYQTDSWDQTSVWDQSNGWAGSDILNEADAMDASGILNEYDAMNAFNILNEPNAMSAYDILNEFSAMSGAAILNEYDPMSGAKILAEPDAMSGDNIQNEPDPNSAANIQNEPDAISRDNIQNQSEGWGSSGGKADDWSGEAGKGAKNQDERTMDLPKPPLILVNPYSNPNMDYKTPAIQPFTPFDAMQQKFENTMKPYQPYQDLYKQYQPNLQFQDFGVNWKSGAPEIKLPSGGYFEFKMKF
jgi:hypothetical protein